MNTYATYAERTLTLSAGKRFEVSGFGLSAGCNINRFSLNAHSDSSGFGLDGGLLLETPSILPELGLMLEGLFMDAKLGDDGPTIPAKVEFALAFSPVRPLKLVGGLSKISGDSLMQYSAGMEFVLLRLAPLNFSFLTGYRTLGSVEIGSLKSDADAFSVGFSMRLSRYRLDYAYDQHSELGDTHRITLGIFQNSPENFHLRRGRQAFEQLDDATAIRELEEVVYLAPRNVEVYHLLALTYERMRQNDEAIRVLQRIQSLNYDYFIENNLDQMMKDIQEQE
jgi:tetratricopeptide (TPR) repeat protein